MRFKGKKIIFSKIDTYSLDETLRPVIATGLEKFLEVLEGQNADPENCTFGVPSIFVDATPGDENYEEALENGTQEWFRVLKKMIYAFSSEEPMLEDGVLEMVSSVDANEQGYYHPMEIKIHDEEAHTQNQKDTEQWAKDVQEGLDLFAKHYNNLWW